MYRLSKSKILYGLQCTKRLWLEIHRPELREDSEATEHRFAIGDTVTEAARRLFPHGRLIGSVEDLRTALRETAAAMDDAEAPILFEPAFQFAGVSARADVFFKGPRRHRLREVKSATGVKPYYLWDAAIQHWVVTGAGHSLATVELAYINNGFVYPGNGDYRGLFTVEDVTGQVEAMSEEVPQWVGKLREVLDHNVPDIGIGKQCNDPFDCPFFDFCQGELPDFPVSILPRGARVAAELRSEGYADLRDVPEDRLTSEVHGRVWRVTKAGRAELGPAAGEQLRALPYPRYYLDFETMHFAVPVWVGTSPYEQLPFQWSCHIETAPGVLAHEAFLDTTGESPMRRFVESLVETLGDEGPVFVYSPFEKRILGALGECFPDLAPAIGAIIERLVDLHPIAKANYYHPDMLGSWSIKAVLPTVAPELDYSSLAEVQNGGMAQEAYAEMVHPETTPERKRLLEKALLDYCALDTLALVRVAQFFQDAVADS